MLEFNPSKVVVQVAVSGVPRLSRAAPQPLMVPPLDLKVTLPVGVPEPGAVTLTVAVKVTDAPKADGFDPLVSATVVVVLALLTLFPVLVTGPAKWLGG